MTVSELIERLKTMPQEAIVVMCMDGMTESGEQWEDNLGDLAIADKAKGKWVYLLNESFT